MNDEEKKGEGDHNADNDNNEKEEDPLDALDDDERKELVNNTEAVCMTLNKVCLSALLLLFLCAYCMSVAAIGLQTLLCHRPFHHHRPSCMV
jgi:hypothetical protein